MKPHETDSTEQSQSTDKEDDFVASDPAKPNRRISTLRKVLTSEAFIEKFALLLLTGALTGILIPTTVGYFTSKAAERQKAIDATRARDAGILQAQGKLLDEASETILTYETLALDVSWYMMSGVKNSALHEKAFAKYTERVVELLTKWRVLISRARTLASRGTSNKLELFLKKILREQDATINYLHSIPPVEKQWDDQHRTSEKLLEEANALIDELSIDLGISKANLHK